MERRDRFLRASSSLGSRSIALFLGASALLGSACDAWLGVRMSPPSPPLPEAPKSVDRLRYSHATHLREAIGCLDCHEGVDRSTSAEVSHEPSHVTCTHCHEPPDMERCTRCHESPRDARSIARRTSDLRFSHAAHMDEVNGNCIRCHADIPRAMTSEDSAFPKMETCTDGCHRDAIDDLRCNLCHSDLSRYRLESIRFMAHGAGFETKHRDRAREKPELCAQCHDRTFCSDCHAGAPIVTPETRAAEHPTRSFIHPAPYEAIHAIDARASRETCESCHRPSFCVSCHASVGLAAVRDLRSFHSTGWLDPHSIDFHGLEARRDIAACAACHDRGAASTCVRCHQVGGTGGNPHPPGFDRREAPEDNRMCRACHWR